MQRPPARSTAERKRRKWAKKAARRAVRAAAAERARLANIDTSAAAWPMVECHDALTGPQSTTTPPPGGFRALEGA